MEKMHINKQINHIYDVQNYMILLELHKNELPFTIPDWEIIYRSMFHDIDKFNGAMADGYCKIRAYLQERGIEKLSYEDVVASPNIFLSLIMHHKNNSHHFEYHNENNVDFSGLDICEMCCDMFDKSKRHQENPAEYLEENLLPRSKFIQKHKDEIVNVFNLLDDLSNHNYEYSGKTLIKKQFIERQISHLRLVHKYMILLELRKNELPFTIPNCEIIYRAMFHDIDKFSPKLADKYCLIEEYYDNKRKGIDNSYIDKNTLYNCCKIHYETQRHHNQFHTVNNCDFSNLDICEFCCDLKAASDREGGNLKEYFDDKILKQDSIFEKNKNDIYYIFDLLFKLNSNNS